MERSAWLRELHEDRPWTFRLLVILVALLAVWPIWFGVGGLLGAFPFRGIDFKAYYLAGLRARQGLPVYGTGPMGAVPDPHATLLLYPPIMAALFVPLTVVPPLASRTAFLLVQFVFLWSAVLVLLRSWDVRLTPGEMLLVGWLLAGVQPVVFLLRVGNITGFMAGFLCLSAATTLGPAGTEKPYLGGALATLAAFPKPYVAPAGAHLLGDRRRLAGAGLAGVTLLVAGVVLFGVGPSATYLDILRTGTAGRVPRPPAPLPRHYRSFAWFDQYPPWRTMLRGVILLVAIVTAGVARDDEREMAFAMGCVTVPLVAPSANTLTLVIALPGLIVAGISEFRRNGRPAMVLAGAIGVQSSVYFVRILRQYGPRYVPAVPWDAIRPVVLLQPGTVGLLAVFGLCVYRVGSGTVREVPVRSRMPVLSEG